MSLKCGIVGLPNVGKSTLFNVLTKAAISAENYPFCTVDPNIGVVAVPDVRLKTIAGIVNPEKIMPATVELVDIAGLVKGASKGEGLGNQFLANIRETDAVAHVVRFFENDNIVHVEGRVNPLDDINTINTELALADLASVEKQLVRLEKLAKAGGDKEASYQLEVLKKVESKLNEGNPARAAALSPEEKVTLRSFFLLTEKPMLYVANVEETGLTDNPLLSELKKFVDSDSSNMIPICVALESQIADMTKEEQKFFLADVGLDEPGLDRLIKATYDLLGLHSFFTAGEKEVRAWAIPKDATAAQAAGVIHTDFQKGFIRAEVISYQDYIENGGESGARNAGKMRLEGKDYLVNDGDIMHFRFNV